MSSSKDREERASRGKTHDQNFGSAAVRSNLRIPPQSLDTEKALLGALLLNSNAMYEVADIVRLDSFYSGQNRMVFEAMLALYEKGQPLDIITVSTKLKDQKRLNEIGGIAFLSELANAAISPGSAKHYADIIQSKFIFRSLIEAGWNIQELGYDEGREVAEALDEAERNIFQVANAPSLKKFISIKEELKGAWDRLEALQKHDKALRGVSTGFAPLDDKLSGFQKSDLIILAARPSMGKTALALDIARISATKHGTPVGIFSLEMSSNQLVDRMLSAEARVDSWKIRTGKVKNDEDFSRLQQGMATLSEAPIYIDDQPGATILSMRSTARRLKLDKGLGLIIVDYLQLITPSNNRAGDNLVQQITEVSRSLKAMARELEVPVLALSQLSRAVEQRGGRPRLSDLRDSGSIEQDADVVMFIHREDMAGTRTDRIEDRTNIAEILIEKHRNGPTGKIELKFDANTTSFLPIDKSDFGDFAQQSQSVGDPF